jgi:hypothetical protein
MKRGHRFIPPVTFSTHYIELYKWNSILDQIRAESESTKPKRDRMRLALHLVVARLWRGTNTGRAGPISGREQGKCDAGSQSPEEQL